VTDSIIGEAPPPRTSNTSSQKINSTVERGNLDRFFTFRIILKIVPVIFYQFFYIKSRMNYGTSYIKAKNHGFVVGSTIFLKKM
jgi:hypothetical protein